VSTCVLTATTFGSIPGLLDEDCFDPNVVKWAGSCYDTKKFLEPSASTVPPHAGFGQSHGIPGIVEAIAGSPQGLGDETKL
jgi:hypothetical protein